jgi:hypothetical protein
VEVVEREAKRVRRMERKKGGDIGMTGSEGTCSRVADGQAQI